MKDDLILEYYSELKKLKKRKLSPKGIYQHLENYNSYVSWKKRNNDLFFYDDKAKELI